MLQNTLTHIVDREMKPVSIRLLYFLYTSTISSSKPLPSLPKPKPITNFYLNVMSMYSLLVLAVVWTSLLARIFCQYN